MREHPAAVFELNQLLLPSPQFDSPQSADLRAKLAAENVSELANLSAEWMKRAPYDWEAHFWNGIVAAQQRRFYVAVSRFRTAERLSPRGNAVAKNLAIAYSALQQDRLFELEMKLAAEQDPRDFAPWYYLGRYYLRSNQFPVALAVEALEHAVQLSPEESGSLCFLAVAKERSGDNENARALFQHATATSSTRPRIRSLAHQGLSRLAISHDPHAALKFAQLAVSDDPGSASAQLQVARVSGVTGDRELAASALKTASRLDQNETPVFYRLAQLSRQTGDLSRSEKAVEAYKQRLSCYGNTPWASQ